MGVSSSFKTFQMVSGISEFFWDLDGVLSVSWGISEGFQRIHDISGNFRGFLRFSGISVSFRDLRGNFRKDSRHV